MEKRGVISARYGWHLIHVLIRSGWIRDDLVKMKGTLKVQGYAVSTEAAKALYNMWRSSEEFLDT